jgi:hypothetical protein
MKRTRKEIHDMLSFLDLVYQLLGQHGIKRHEKVINDFYIAVNEIHEIKETQED